MKAIWKDVTLAESDKTIVVEDNHYFPPDSIKREYFNDESYQGRFYRSGKHRVAHGQEYCKKGIAAHSI